MERSALVWSRCGVRVRAPLLAAVEREGALVALVPVAAGVNVGDQVERVRIAIGRALPGIGSPSRHSYW